MPATVRLNAELTDPQARDLAQFLKRVTFSDFEQRAMGKDEAYRMQDADAVLRKALAEAGYETR